MRTRLVWIIAALALVAAGCGDDDTTAATASTTASGGTATTAGGDASSTTSAPAEGGQGASNLMLLKTDFPAGWTSTPADPDQPGIDGSDVRMRKCLGVPPADGKGSVDSPDFEKGQSHARSSAHLVGSIDVVEADWKAIHSADFLPCVNQQVEAELAKREGVVFEGTSVADLSFPSLGDGTRAVRASTFALALGHRVPAYIDVVFVRKGLAEFTLTFVSLGAEFPPDLAGDLGRKLVSRA